MEFVKVWNIDLVVSEKYTWEIKLDGDFGGR